MEFQPVLTMEEGGSGGPELLIFQQKLDMSVWREITRIEYLGNKIEFVKDSVQAEVSVGRFEPVSVVLFFLTCGKEEVKGSLVEVLDHLLWSAKEWPP